MSTQKIHPGFRYGIKDGRRDAENLILMDVLTKLINMREDKVGEQYISGYKSGICEYVEQLENDLLAAAARRLWI